MKKLHKRLRPKSAMEFAHLGDTVHTPDGPAIYIDHGAPILGVAHLDYVMWAKPHQFGHIVRCPQLDDRLGVWILLDVLPSYGIKCDVLLTDSEERGLSTGEYFDPPKRYNWMFQFDRAGTDATMYQYERLEHTSRLADYGITVNYGSFSDISTMEHLRCVGINFGCGYRNQHTNNCYANLHDTKMMVRKFRSFASEYQHVPLPHEPGPLPYHDSTEQEYIYDVPESEWYFKTDNRWA